MDKKTFLCYTDWHDMVEFVPNEDCGVIFKSLLALYSWDEDAYDKILEEELCRSQYYGIFNFMRKKIESNTEKYEEKKKINSDNGRKWGNPNFVKWAKNPYYKDNQNITEDNTDITKHNQKITEDNRTQPKITEDNPTVTDTKTDTKTITETITETVLTPKGVKDIVEDIEVAKSTEKEKETTEDKEEKQKNFDKDLCFLLASIARSGMLPEDPKLERFEAGFGNCKDEEEKAYAQERIEYLWEVLDLIKKIQWVVCKDNDIVVEDSVLLRIRDTKKKLERDRETYQSRLWWEIKDFEFSLKWVQQIITNG